MNLRPAIVALLLPLLCACSNQDSPRARSSGAERSPAASHEGGEKPGSLTLLGHDPLFGRGLNAAATVFDHYLYVGNRTDGSSRCGLGDPRRTTTGIDSCPHPHPGVLILDIADPSSPTVVGEMGPPYAGLRGISTRELRVWPEKQLLVIMSFRCSSFLHACVPGNDKTFPFDLKFFDLSDPVNPRFIASYVPTSRAGKTMKPHEMFLWADPQNSDRALVYLSTPSFNNDPVQPNLMVIDISHADEGTVRLVAEENFNQFFPGSIDILPNFSNCGSDPYGCNLFTHSMSLSADGRRIFLSQEAGEAVIGDSSDLANDVPAPRVRLLTDPATRPTWANPNGHSFVKVPGRDLAVSTDEIYGTFTDPSFGCPWGWARVFDIADPVHISIVGEYKIAQDQPSFCGSAADDPLTEQFTSYSAHNLTITRHLAFVDWHSGGLQAIDITHPTNPTKAASFSPEPLARIANEDPALSRGPNKVVLWSYPIIRDGLIYAIDIRNGLYVTRYEGPHQGEVSQLSFLEGNSNLGDALRLDTAGSEHDEGGDD